MLLQVWSGGWWGWRAERFIQVPAPPSPPFPCSHPFSSFSTFLSSLSVVAPQHKHLIGYLIYRCVLNTAFQICLLFLLNQQPIFIYKQMKMLQLCNHEFCNTPGWLISDHCFNALCPEKSKHVHVFISFSCWNCSLVFVNVIKGIMWLPGTFCSSVMFKKARLSSQVTADPWHQLEGFKRWEIGKLVILHMKLVWGVIAFLRGYE